MTKVFLKQQIVAQTALTLFASQKNSKDWSPKDALEAGEEIYVIQYKREGDYFLVYPFDESDTFAINDVYFEHEAGAQEFIDKHLDILQQMVENIEDEEYKELFLDVVAATAVELIDNNGSTTTLDVKKALRAAGYTAEQSEVSDYIQKVLHTENLRVSAASTNGKSYLVFSK